MCWVDQDVSKVTPTPSLTCTQPLKRIGAHRVNSASNHRYIKHDLYYDICYIMPCKNVKKVTFSPHLCPCLMFGGLVRLLLRTTSLLLQRIINKLLK